MLRSDRATIDVAYVHVGHRSDDLRHLSP